MRIEKIKEILDEQYSDYDWRVFSECSFGISGQCGISPNNSTIESKADVLKLARSLFEQVPVQSNIELAEIAKMKDDLTEGWNRL